MADASQNNQNVDAVIRAEQLDEPVELFAGFNAMPLPDALDALLYRVDTAENPAGIELYAKRTLTELGLSRLKRIASETRMNLARIERTGAFYINYQFAAVNAQDRRYLSALEATLNRLSRVLDQMGCALKPATASPSEDGCSVYDQMAFSATTGAVPALLENTPSENPLSCPGTVTCQPGGEWDIRSRFALLMEGLNVITRLDYDFDVNARAHMLHVRVASTPALAMPSSVFDPQELAWEPVDAFQREEWAREHDARVALVVGAAAFATSPSIELAYVTMGTSDEQGNAGEEGDPSASEPITYLFSRGEFMATYVPLAKDLWGWTLRGGMCFDKLAAARLEGQVPAMAPAAYRAPVREDERELPEPLRTWLLADRVCELEVMEDHADPYSERLVAIREQLETSPQEAVEALADFIAELEASCAVKELSATRPVLSQFCEGYMARLLWPLVCDDADMRVLRAPDALYFAQSTMAELYTAAGNYEQALPEVHKQYDLARSSVQAHFSLVNVLARLERYEEVVEVCRHAVRIVVDREQVGYLFYRVAYAFWQLGRRDVALACYRLVPRGETMADAAKEETQGLMAEMGVNEMPSLKEAVATVESQGIEVPPTARVRNRVSDLAVVLTDSGFFDLAGKCILQMWRTVGADELNAVFRSLQ